MTFYEAAIEILRKAGRPLHYKKITELAIKQALLSHIGKTPEVTMQARLNQEAQKEWGAAITRVRPGVFVLVKDFDLADVKETVTQPPSVGLPGAEEGSQPLGESLGVAAVEVGKEESEVPFLAVATPEETTGAIRPAPAALGAAWGPEAPDLKAGPDPRRASRPMPRPMAAIPAEPSQGEEVVEVLRRAAGPLSTQELVSQLGQVGGARISVNTLELHLAEENRSRLKQGIRPRFIRQGGGWVLTERLLDRRLSTQYQALEAAHAQITGVTVEAMAQRLEKLSPGAAEAVVLSTLRGMGFTCRVVERRESLLTVEARAGLFLVPLTVLVRLWQRSQPLTGDDVAALRGQLHHFGATHGAFVVLTGRGVDVSAEREAASSEQVPIIILNAREFAPLALQSQIGVLCYPVEVPILDATWFV